MSAKVYVGAGRIYEFFQKCRDNLEISPAIVAEESDRGFVIRLGATEAAAVMSFEVSDGDDIHFYTVESHTIEEDDDPSEFMKELSGLYEDLLGYYILGDNPRLPTEDDGEDDAPSADDLEDMEIQDRIDAVFAATEDFLEVIMKYAVDSKTSHGINSYMDYFSDLDIMEFATRTAENLFDQYGVSCFVPTNIVHADGTEEVVCYPCEW